ncbi:hypothetical protein NQZ68_008405 [Dissostichus eleginoides]|nr:hypothetical protein NQZ68_008405 [Dissostichus eleginoides]
MHTDVMLLSLLLWTGAVSGGTCQRGEAAQPHREGSLHIPRKCTFSSWAGEMSAHFAEKRVPTYAVFHPGKISIPPR